MSSRGARKSALSRHEDLITQHFAASGRSRRSTYDRPESGQSRGLRLPWRWVRRARRRRSPICMARTSRAARCGSMSPRTPRTAPRRGGGGGGRNSGGGGRGGGGGGRRGGGGGGGIGEPAHERAYRRARAVGLSRARRGAGRTTSRTTPHPRSRSAVWPAPSSWRCGLARSRSDRPCDAGCPTRAAEAFSPPRSSRRGLRRVRRRWIASAEPQSGAMTSSIISPRLRAVPTDSASSTRASGRSTSAAQPRCRPAFSATPQGRRARDARCQGDHHEVLGATVHGLVLPRAGPQRLCDRWPG